MTNIRTNPVETSPSPTKWWQIEIIAVAAFMLVLGGCASVTFHRPIEKEIVSGRFKLICDMGDRSCVLTAGGDSAKLVACVVYDELVNYYRSFEPQKDHDYYDFEVIVIGSLPPDSTKLRFEFVCLRYGGVADTFDISRMQQRTWLYSGNPAVGVEPIPIPPFVKEGVLDLEISVSSVENLQSRETINISVPIQRRKITRTIANPWP